MSMRTYFLSNFHTSVGLICLQFKQNSKAKNAFTSSILVIPTAAAYCGLGISFLQCDDYESAIDSFWAATELDPQNEYDLQWLNWARHLYYHAPRVRSRGCHL